MNAVPGFNIIGEAVGVAEAYGGAAAATLPISATIGISALLLISLYEGVAHGIPTYGPAHHDPSGGVAEDDDDDNDDPAPGGKGIQPQPGGKGIPAQTHSSHQDAYIGQENEYGSDYWHKFNIICRKFYNRHRRLAVSHPEKYAMALFYFVKRYRRLPRRVVNRSALIEGPRDYHMDWTMMKNHPVARRARGRVFLAS